MTAWFRNKAFPTDSDAVAAALVEDFDFARRDLAAEDFLSPPPAAFVVRAYAACHGRAPTGAQFIALRDRLLSGQASRTALLKELAQATGTRIAGLARRDAVMRSLAANPGPKAVRLGRDILRLPHNLRRQWRQAKPVAPPASGTASAAPRGAKPRIAILSIASAEKGGAERFYAGLCDSLNAAGMAAELIALESREHNFSAIEESYRRFFDLDLSAYDGVISAKAPTYAARHPNHVCYLMHTMRAWYDMFEASHPFALPGTHQKRRRIQALDTAALQAVRARLAVGEEVARRLRAYNGLDAAVLRHPSTLTGLHQGGFEHLLLPGRLHPWKRVDLAIAAMRYVTSPTPLMIAGGGEDETRLRALARGDSRIIFAGQISETELAGLYADAALVLFLPQREDLGLVTLEGFACAKPLITCADSGEPARLVRDGENGFVCPPDPRRIAEKIDLLLGDKARAASLGLAGQASVAAITWPLVARTLITALGF